MRNTNRKYHPPRFAQWLISKILTDYNKWAILGDLEEEFFEIFEEKGLQHARWFYVKYLFKTIPHGLIHYIYWGSTMFRSYLKIAVRNLIRNKGYSLINILSLAIGMACAMVIFLYVNFETTYDNFHQDLERKFRVMTKSVTATETSVSSRTAGPIGPTFLKDYPQVESYTRILPLSNGLVRFENKMFYEERIFADSELFEMFSVDFIRGTKEKVLERPNTCVLTERVSKKYFGNDNPIGKILLINNREYEVNGIIVDSPQNTHYQFHVIMSLSTIKERYPWDHWFLVNFFTYVKLQENTNMEEFSNSIANIFMNYVPDQIADMEDEYSVELQPLTDIHTTSNIEEQNSKSANVTTLNILSLTGIFILLIACINFINLSTARSAKRAKEVGLRKVVGGFRKQLVWQFMGETFLLCLFAGVISFGFLFYGLKLLNEFGGIDLPFANVITPQFILLAITLLTVVTLIAGSYPSFILSSFKPVIVLKSGVSKIGGRAGLRKFLVISQFSASVILIIATIIVFNQISFMKEQNLGFVKEKKLVLPINGPVSIRDNYETVKSEFMKHSNIVSASCGSHTPGEFGMNYFHTDMPTETSVITEAVYFYYIDTDYIGELGLKLIAGRNFQRNSLSDQNSSLILNRTAVSKFGYSDPQEVLGRRMFGIFDTASVVGVIDDFHLWGLQNEIEPLILAFTPRMFERIILTISGDASEAISFANEKWDELFPSNPFEYYFLDEQFNKLYDTEEKFGNLFGYFAGLGLFIACIGLLGLASFTAEQKTKEIGIRKTLGSSINEIIILLSKDFTKWIIVGNLIAWPIAYYGMRIWLEDFAYKSEINLLHFGLAGVITLLIAFLAVSYQSIKAARANPVDAIKYE